MASSSHHSLDPSRLSVKEAKGFSHLRQLLLAPEQTELERLKNRLDHYILEPSDVGRVLPDAIRLRAQQDSRLLSSMIPITQEALSLSIKHSPHLISDFIAPIIGPAIRKATARAMRGMVQSMNQTLEYSMSLKGMKWRWEAYRTGKPFAEVVLLKTLRFRVEQVFLIHRKSGLLLNHVVADGVTGQGEEVISGMLTAIQDFVRDSFGQSQEEGLESLRIGDLTVWVEQGSGAILAGVIRGAPPTELREIFQETLEMIHAQFSEPLQAFKGDATFFEEARLPLEDCLQAQFEPKAKGLPWAVWVLLALLSIGIGWWAYQAFSEKQRWGQLEERIGQEPGLVMTSVQEGSPTIFYGLKDPLASNPEQILSDLGYSSSDVVFRLEPFMDLTPEFVRARAMIQLRPPGTVILGGEGRTLALSGEASHAWVEQTRLLGPLITGVSHIDMKQLVDTDVRQFETVKASLERKVLAFGVGEFDLREDQRSTLMDIVHTIQRLDHTAGTLRMTPRVQILGFSSPDGRSEVNTNLSRRRAQTVQRELEAVPLQAVSLAAEGSRSEVSSAVFSQDSPVSQGRHVVFKVVETLSRPPQNLQ